MDDIMFVSEVTGCVPDSRSFVFHICKKTNTATQLTQASCTRCRVDPHLQLFVLDLSAAVDTRNDNTGIKGTALIWFKSYLSDRFQFVCPKVTPPCKFLFEYKKKRSYFFPCWLLCTGSP